MYVSAYTVWLLQAVQILEIMCNWELTEAVLALDRDIKLEFTMDILAVLWVCV